MLGADIVLFLQRFRNLRRLFRGTFASDQVQALCRDLKDKTFAICNTDSLAGPGQHWFVIFRLEGHFGKKSKNRLSKYLNVLLCLVSRNF